MPLHLKVRRGVTKFAIRKAAREWLPAEILRREKQGFMLPVAYWLNGKNLVPLQAPLRQSRLVKEGWIERAAINRLFSEHNERREDHHVRIWMLINLDAWYRIYLDGEKVDTSGKAALVPQLLSV
jgi:asparagine synthase (glutamine-hydrolysing)